MSNKTKIFIITISLLLSTLTQILVWSFEFHKELILPVDKVFTFIIYLVLYKELFKYLYNICVKENIEIAITSALLSTSSIGLFILLPLVLWSTISQMVEIKISFFIFLVLTLGSLVIYFDSKDTNTERRHL